jgi:putative peptide zinc metalloprotease protein
MENKLLRLKPEIRFRAFSTPNRFVAEDRPNQKFWRLGSLEYEVCAFLETPVLMEDVQKLAPRISLTLSQADPERVSKAIVWLLQSGIVESVESTPGKVATDTLSGAPPFKMFDPSFFRIHLIGGETLEKLAKPFLWLVSYPALIVAVCLCVSALVAGYQNWEKLASLSTNLFVPGSQWWFLIAWTILKFVHESGHALACLRVGTRPSSAGIGFIFFTPSPFVDATSSWNLEDRRSRILISAAGILFEATFACAALLLACWSNSPTLQYLCVSIVTLGTISTFAFNGNPLLRFDGYYILIDLIGRPNLWQDANRLMKQFFKGLVTHSSPISQWTPLVLGYGIASFGYRILTLTTLAWGLWVAWDGVGLIVASAFAVLWFIVPKFTKPKQSPAMGPETKPSFWQEVSVPKLLRLSAFACAVAALGFLPSPFQIYWPGTVEFVDPVDLRSAVSGRVEKVFYHDGQGVREGDELMRLTNPELELEFQQLELDWKLAQERCNLLRAQRRTTELKFAEEDLEASHVRYQSYKDKISKLSIRAPRDGVLMLRGSTNLPGMFIEEGSALGRVVDPFRLEVRASAPADRWDTLSQSSGRRTKIQLSNGEVWKGELIQVLPRTTDFLEFPALAGLYGGVLTVKTKKSENGSEEHRTLEPRCQLRIALLPNSFERSIWGSEHRPKLPPPGILCCVKLTGESESAWGTAFRWIKAALRVRFAAENAPI